MQPAITWDLQSNSLFGVWNGAYVRAWDRIIEEEWGAEVFTTVQPSYGFAYTGLLQTIQWCGGHSKLLCPQTALFNVRKYVGFAHFG